MRGRATIKVTLWRFIVYIIPKSQVKNMESRFPGLRRTWICRPIWVEAPKVLGWLNNKATSNKAKKSNFSALFDPSLCKKIFRKARNLQILDSWHYRCKRRRTGSSDEASTPKTLLIKSSDVVNMAGLKKIPKLSNREDPLLQIISFLKIRKKGGGVPKGNVFFQQNY